MIWSCDKWTSEQLTSQPRSWYKKNIEKYRKIMKNQAESVQRCDLSRDTSWTGRLLHGKHPSGPMKKLNQRSLKTIYVVNGKRNKPPSGIVNHWVFLFQPYPAPTPLSNPRISASFKGFKPVCGWLHSIYDCHQWSLPSSLGLPHQKHLNDLERQSKTPLHPFLNGFLCFLSYDSKTNTITGVQPRLFRAWWNLVGSYSSSRWDTDANMLTPLIASQESSN